jgi:hypothetical protein
MPQVHGRPLISGHALTPGDPRAKAPGYARALDRFGTRRTATQTTVLRDLIAEGRTLIAA